MSDEGKPDNKAILARAGLLKTPVQDGQGAAQGGQGDVKPTNQPIDGTPTPPPTFTVIPDGSSSKETKTTDTGVDPGDATLPEGPRKVVTQLRTHIKNLESQLRSKGDINPEEIKQLKEERDRALDLVAELDLVKDPRFQEQFDTPRKSLISKMEDVIELYGGNKDEIIAGLQNKSWKEQIEFLKDNLSEGRSEMIPLLKDMAAIDEKRTALLSNKQTAKQQLIAQRQEAEQQVMNQAFDIVFKQEADAGSDLLREIPGEDAFNKNVIALKRFATSLDHGSPMALAALKVKAAQEPIWRTMFKQEQQARIALQKQLNAMGAAIPSSNGSSAPRVDVGNNRKPMSAAEAAKLSASRL